MSQKKPIVIAHPGKLTAAAKKAGQSIPAFAASHLDDPALGAAARLYHNVLAPANNRREHASAAPPARRTQKNQHTHYKIK